MLRRFSLNFAIFSMLMDGMSVVFGLYLSSILRPWLNQFSVFEPLESPIFIPLSLYIVFPLIWVMIFTALSIYDGKKYLRAVDEFTALSLAILIASISAAGILYFSFRQVSRALFVLFVLFSYILALIWRITARVYFRQQVVSPLNQRRIIIVGDGPLGQNIEEQIKKTANPILCIIGFVDDHDGGHTQLLGGKAEIKDLVNHHQISDVVIALPHSAYGEMSKIVQNLEESPVQVWVALGFFDLALYKTGIEDFSGIPMLDLRASALDDYERMLKRGFDVLLSMVGLFITFPIMMVCALAIFIEDGRPILFRQKRAGENGRVFDMLKFRTMIRNAENLQSTISRVDENGNLIHKTRHDPRVTRVGSFLRRFSLDELPQLFNILGGTMSLVGPRPEMPYLVEKYQPWQRKRFAVPPGLTGWWQVSGRSDRPMHLHTEDDLYYIQNYSIWLDIQILVRTVWVVIIGKGSY